LSVSTLDHRRALGVWSPRGIEHCDPVVQTTVRSPSDGFHPLCEELDSALPAVFELDIAVKRLQATAVASLRYRWNGCGLKNIPLNTNTYD